MLTSNKRGYAIATEPSFFTVLWNQKALVVGIVAVAAAIGLGLSLAQPASYEAEATVVITDPNTAQELTDQMGLERSAFRNVSNQAAFMESIGSHITTAIEKNTGIILVIGTASTAGDAVATVDTMYQTYAASMQESSDTAAQELLSQLDDRQSSAEAEVAQLEAEILAAPDNPTLRTKQSNAINELRVVDRQRSKVENQHVTYGSGIQAFSPEDPPATASGAFPIRNAIIAAILGLLIATGVSWVRGTKT